MTPKPLRSKRRAAGSSAAALHRQLAEIAVAAPQVIAHRMTRMAIAGAQPSERDRKEFTGMVAEKQLAFSQALTTFTTETAKAQMKLGAEVLTALSQPLSLTPAKAAQWAHDAGNSAMDVAAKAMSPVHKKATANARRLAKTKLR